MTTARAFRPLWALSLLLLAAPGRPLAQASGTAPQGKTQPTQSQPVQTGPAQAQPAQRAVPGARPFRTTPVASLDAKFASLFQKARPATVEIDDCPPVASDPGCKDPDGIGSGVLISADGSMLTAYHVVFGAKRLEAVTLDKKRYPITVVGFDEPRDLALLKINVSGAKFVPLAERAPQVGQGALAIGNSGGGFLQPKSGRLLGLNAEAGRADFPAGTFKMDAPLAPGDSGGPILNEAGQLIGISSYIRYEPALVSTSGGQDSEPQMSSYAVPVSVSSPLLADLRRGVKREAPVAGITASTELDDLAPAFFQQLGLGDKVGFVFVDVVKGGPAERAGLRPLKATSFDKNGVPTRATADVITAVDDKPVQNFVDFLAAVRSHQVGDKVTLSIIRDGASTPLKVPLTLAPRTITVSQNR